MDDHIKREKEILVKFFKNQNTKIDNLKNSNIFIEEMLKTIIAVKIWKQNLSDIPDRLQSYLAEIVSDLNQVILLAIQGYKIPSYILLRRCLENMVQILYYKDHKVEFYKKILHKESNHIKINDYKEYIVKFPFICVYPKINIERLQKLVKKNVESWRENYKELSNYVHGTTLEYLELAEFIEEIKPNDKFLSIIIKQIQEFSSIFNVLFIIFFFKLYKQLDPREKEWIRTCIQRGSHYLRELTNIFKEI